MAHPQVDIRRDPFGSTRLRARFAGSWLRYAPKASPAISGLLVLGAVCGVLAKVADEAQVRWVGDLGTYPAVWVLALALISRFSPSPGSAAVRAATFFTATCLAYYGWSLFVMDFAIDRNLWLWMGIAVTAVPVIAALAKWASGRSGLLPGLILAAIAALAVADGIVWQLWWAWGGNGAPEGFPLRPFQAVINISVALVIIGALPERLYARIWAAALLIPSAILIARVVDLVMGNLMRLI